MTQGGRQVAAPMEPMTFAPVDVMNTDYSPTLGQITTAESPTGNIPKGVQSYNKALAGAGLMDAPPVTAPEPTPERTTNFGNYNPRDAERDVLQKAGLMSKPAPPPEQRTTRYFPDTPVVSASADALTAQGGPDAVGGTVNRLYGMAESAYGDAVGAGKNPYDANDSETAAQLARGKELARQYNVDLSNVRIALGVLKKPAHVPQSAWNDIYPYLDEGIKAENARRGEEHKKLSEAAFENAEAVDPAWHTAEKRQQAAQKVEAMKPGVLKSAAGGWESFVNTALLPQIAASGDMEQFDKVRRAGEFLGDVQARNMEGRAGIDKMANETASILIPMVPNLLAGATAFMPGAGPVIAPILTTLASSTWGLEGAGEMLLGVAEKGGDVKDALTTSLRVGMLYAALEQMQITQVGRAAAVPIKKSALQSAVKYATNRVADLGKELNEEGVQGATIVGSVAHALKEQGYDIDANGLVKEMTKRYGEDAVGAVWGMGGLALLGAGVGGARMGYRKATGKTAAYDAEARENAETIRQSKQDFDAMDAGTYQTSTQAQAAQQGATARVALTTTGQGTQFAGRGMDAAEVRENVAEINDNEVWAAELPPDTERATTRDSDEATAEPEPEAAKATEDAVREYQESTDDNLVNFVQDVKDGVYKNPAQRNYPLGQVTEQAAADINRLTEIDATGFERNINGDAVKHIERRHGVNGEHDHSMADINDYGRIKYVLNNYDNAKLLYDDEGNIKVSGNYKNSKGEFAPLVMYEKRVNGTFYVVEAVPDSKAKTLQIVSAYKTNTKKGDRQELDVVQPPKLNVRNELAPSPNNKINDLSEKVNSEDEESQKSFEGEDGDSGDLRFSRRSINGRGGTSVSPFGSAVEAGVPAEHLDKYPNARKRARELWDEKGTRSPFFKKWFGDWEKDPANASKVVYENGAPMVVYHGTNEDFNTFNKERQKSGYLGEGFYFTDDKEYAKNYGGKTVTAYLSMKNPLMLSDETSKDKIEKMLGVETGIKQSEDVEYWTKFLIGYRSDIDGQKELKKLGFDGIIIKMKTGVNYVVFDSNQVKSATDNVGTFDSGNPDIRFARRGGKSLPSGENYIKRGRISSNKTNLEGLLDEYTQRERDNLAGNKRIHIAQNEEQIHRFINDAVTRKNSGEKLLVGKIGEHLSNRIEGDTEINLRGYNLELRSDEIRHLIKEHGIAATELPRGQRAITTEDIYRFIDIVANYDAVELARDNSLHFKKDIDGTITAVSLYAGKSKSLSLKTMYAGEKGGRLTTPHTTPAGERAMNTPNDADSQALSNKIIDLGEKVNSENEKSQKSFSDSRAAQYSPDDDPAPITLRQFRRLLDRLGRTGLAKDVITDADEMRKRLSRTFGEGAADRFMSVWHGSPHAFDKFSTAFMGTGEGNQSYGWGLYFTDVEEIARGYGEQQGTRQYPVILNGKKYEPDAYGKHPASRVAFRITWHGGYVDTARKYVADQVSTYTELAAEKERKIAKITRDDSFVLANLRNDLQYYKKRLADVTAMLQVFDAKGFAVDDRAGSLYNVKIHGDKTIDDLNFIRWDKPLTDKNKTDIYNQARKENLGMSRSFWSGKNAFFESGERAYSDLGYVLGSQKAASEFLLRAGIDGIQYPTGYLSKGTHEDSYNYVVFDDKALEIVEHIRLMSTPDDEVYGFATKDGKIYLDPAKMNANTPIHEYGHLWIDFVKKHNNPLYKRIVYAAAQSEFYKELKANPAYAHLSHTERAEEATARAIADAGEVRFLNERGLEKFKQFLRDLWDWVAERLGLSGRDGLGEMDAEDVGNLTFAEIAEGGARELLGGREIGEAENDGAGGENYISGDNSSQKGERQEVANRGFDKTGKPVYEGNFPHGTPKATKQQRILHLIQNVWSKKPLTLNINEPDGTTRQIEARFDPTYDPNNPRIQTDVSKLLAGNRHGSAKDQRVTLDLADDWYEIAETSTYNYSKAETGKSTDTHGGVKEWHYFINDIMFQEYGQNEASPYRVTINIKERKDGNFVYSISAERAERAGQTERERKEMAGRPTAVHATGTLTPISGNQGNARLEPSSAPQDTETRLPNESGNAQPHTYNIGDFPENVNSKIKKSENIFEGEDGDSGDLRFARRTVSPAERERRGTWIDQALKMTESKPENAIIGTAFSGLTEGKSAYKELLSKDEMNTLHLKKIRLDTLPKDSGNRVTFTSGGVDFSAKYDPEEKTWDVRRDARYSVTMPEDAGIYVDKTKIEILEWQKKALERKLAGMEKKLLNSRLALEQSIDNLEDKLKGRYEERMANLRDKAGADIDMSRFRKKMAEDRLKVAENDLKAVDDNLTGRRKYVKQVQSEIYKYAKSLGLKELPSDWARILIEHKPLEELGHSTLRELREATHKLDVMWYEQEGKRLGEKIENIAANEYIRQKGLHNKRASTVDLEANRKIWDMLDDLRKREIPATQGELDDGYADYERHRIQDMIDDALNYYQMYGGRNIRNNRNYDLAGIPKTDRRGKPTEYREEMIEWIEGRSGIPKFLTRAIKSQFTQNIKYMTNEEKNSWLMDFKDIKSDGVTRRERQIREEKEEHEKQVEAILGVLNNVWGEAENVEAWANFMEEPKPKSPRKINADFNRKLRQQIDGTLRAGYVYDLGNPGAILRAAGVDDLPIELESRVLSKKSSEGYHGNHPFDISQIMNLPNAINNPIAIFDDDSGADGGKRILTELQYKGVNFVVAMRVRTDKKSRKTMATVNSIRTIFPKDRVSDVFDWFYGKNDLLRWVDKEKARRFVSIHSTDRNADGNESRAIDKVMAKINGFENPKSATGQASKQRFDSAEVGDNPDRTNNNISDSEEKVNTQDKKNNIGWFKTLGLKKGLRNLGMIFDNTRPELIIRRLEDSVGKDEADAIFEYLSKPEIRAENKFLGKYIKEADEAIADIHADLKLAFLRDEELLTIRMQNGGKRVVTYNAAMAVYAHSKNPHNRTHLSGTGFTDEQIEEICAALPQEYRDAVEKTRLYMSAEIFPKVSEMYAKEHQVDMRPEEDYWPIRDLDFAGLGGVTATMEEMASRHESQRANLNKGMMKARTNSDAAFRQLDYMGTLLTSVRDALYTVAFNDAITQANKLLGDKRIVATLNRISPDVVPALRQHYKDVANMRRHPEDGGDSTSDEIFPTVMRNLAIASMGYNLSTIVKQYVAVPQGMAVMDSPKSALYVAQVLAEWMKSPKALREFVYERSPLVANRATNREREFLEMAESGRADRVIKMKLLQKLKSSGLDTKYKVAEVHRAIQEHSMLGAQFGDMLSAITLWKARYNQIMDRTGGNEERAIEDADELIRRTQSQGGIIHLPETFRSRNPFVRSFTMFMNQPNQVFNMLIDTICGAKNRGVWKTAYRALMAHVAPSMLLYFITKGRLAPDEPEELIDIAVEDALGGVLFWGWFPTASASAVSNWVRYARGRESEWPMGSLISPTLEEFRRWEDILEDPKKWDKASTIEAMARVAGLPVNQPKRTYKAIKKGVKAVEDEDWWGLADAATRRQWLSDYALRDKGVFAAMAKRANKAPSTDDFERYHNWYVNKITIAEQEKFEDYYIGWLDNMANADRNEEFRLVLSNVKARNPRRALWAMSRLGNWGYSTKDKFKEWYSDKERDKAEKSAEAKKMEAENYKKVVEVLQGMGSIP